MPDSMFSADYGILLQQLLRARQSSGLTQNDIAAKMGVVRTVIGKIERGERRIDVIELRDYCNAVNIPLQQFIQQLENAIAHSR